jgi:general secretion pathway protein K
MAAILKDDKGIALILTITLIGLIVVMVMQFSKTIRTSLYETTNFSDGIRLKSIAKSGFNCALSVLYEDEVNVDSLHDDWASLNQYSSISTSLFDNDGAFQVEVADLAGRIQINRLIYTSGEHKGEYNQTQMEQLQRLLGNAPFNIESDKIKDILDPIKDWIDEDSDQELHGAEDSYYRSLDHPYSCRNGQLESVDELLLIKGITPELLYGTGETPGLANYLTVVGDGKININTADPVVLLTLSDDLDSSMVEEMAAYRNDEKNESNLTKLDWYKTAITTSDDKIDRNSITIKSSYFEIRSRGIKDNISRECLGIVRREGKNLSMLSWKMS